MSERNGTVTPPDPGTRPIVVAKGATAVAATAPAGGAPRTGPLAAAGAPAPAADPAGADPTAMAPTVTASSAGAPTVTASSAGAPTAVPPTAAAPTGAAELPPGVHPTAPVSVRPKARLPRRGPLTVMGPWAPVAGGLVGLLLGLFVTVLLAGAAGSFEDRLALAFTVVGLGMLGTAGTLLADEVRMLRRQAREAAVRPQWVESTASMLNGLTPARLLLGVSAFVLFLAAFVSRG